MPLFMAQFSYTPQAWAAIVHATQDRAAASDALVRHFGGKLVGLYYTPGAEYDGFALFEAPDGAAASAVEVSAFASATCGPTASRGYSPPRRCSPRSSGRPRRPTSRRRPSASSHRGRRGPDARGRSKTS